MTREHLDYLWCQWQAHKRVSDVLLATGPRQPGESGVTDEFLLRAPSGGHYEGTQVINQRLALLA